MSNATFLRRVENVDRLPDGVYFGHWGGYVVVFTCEGSTYEVQTEDGIRTPRAPCKVTIKDGKIIVSLTSGV